MALDKFPKQIGEHTYEVTTLGAKMGLKVGMRLTKALARGTELEELKAGGITVMGAITKAFAHILIALPEEDFDFIVSTFAQSTVVVLSDEQRPSLAKMFDLQFAGRYEDFIEWLKFCVEVNYGPLVDAWKVRLGSALLNALGVVKPGPVKAKAPSPSTSPPASPGTSNAS